MPWVCQLFGSNMHLLFPSYQGAGRAKRMVRARTPRRERSWGSAFPNCRFKWWCIWSAWVKIPLRSLWVARKSSRWKRHQRWKRWHSKTYSTQFRALLCWRLQKRRQGKAFVKKITNFESEPVIIFHRISHVSLWRWIKNYTWSLRVRSKSRFSSSSTNFIGIN